MTSVGNEVLRRALAEAYVTEDDLALRVGVGPKTVQRWVAGRMPHPRHRRAVARVLGRDEDELWLEASPQSQTTVGTEAVEIVAAYPHRGAVPRQVWRDVFAAAQTEIDILASSAVFLAEDLDVMRTLHQRAVAGVRVRLLLSDPDAVPGASPDPRPETDRAHPADPEDDLVDAITAQVRTALVLFRPLTALDTVQVRLRDGPLYASLYRADGDILVNQHVHGVADAYTPVLHLRAGTDLPPNLDADVAADAVPATYGADLLAVYRTAFDRAWTAAARGPSGSRVRQAAPAGPATAV